MIKRTVAVLLIALLAAVVGVGIAAPVLYAFTYTWEGGHDAAGVTTPSNSWYFAEGCTRPGFDCWLCVMNPQAQAASLDVSFLTPVGAEGGEGRGEANAMFSMVRLPSRMVKVPCDVVMLPVLEEKEPLYPPASVILIGLSSTRSPPWSEAATRIFPPGAVLQYATCSAP